MSNLKNKKRLQIILFLLIIVVVLGVGYASISAINLIVNSNAIATTNQENFSVKFLDEDGARPSIEGSPTNNINVISDTVAAFNITTLSRKGESVTATLKVKNTSNGIGTLIGLNLVNSNTEYFKVTEKILDNKLQAGETTTVTVKVEMLKTPITDSVSTTITATLTANPLENEQATGGSEKKEISPSPYVYSVTSNNINNEIIGTTFQTFDDVKEVFVNKPASIAHVLNGTIIKESYVAFEKNGDVYYIRGGAGDESEQENMPIYDANVRELKKAFGSSWENYCSENEVRFGADYFICSDETINIHADQAGYVAVYPIGGGWSCSISNSSNSNCNGY